VNAVADLRHTTLAVATAGSIRLKLLKTLSRAFDRAAHRREESRLRTLRQKDSHSRARGEV
jgi:hypothetical protein